MSTTSASSVAQLCERTRRLIASTRTQSASATVKREHVIRELRHTAQRQGASSNASTAHRQIAMR